MKKIIYAIAFILCASLAQAQTYTPDDMLTVLGFTVTIDNAGSGSDPDSAWETCSGGSLNIEVADSSVACDNVHTTTPGHKYIDTFSNLRISGKCDNSISAINKSEMNLQVTEKGFYSLRFEGYDAAGNSLFRFICKELDLKNLYRNKTNGIDTSQFQLTITYNLENFKSEILMRSAESLTSLTLYECEPVIPMAFGDPTYPLLQNLAYVEVKIDKAEECAISEDCEFGYECNMGICIESECHYGSSDGLILPKLCDPPGDCVFANPIAEIHGNGTCIETP